MFAGVTVMLAIVGVQRSGIPMLAMMGWGAAIMVAVTMLAAVTLLPALLGVAGRGSTACGSRSCAAAAPTPRTPARPAGRPGARHPVAFGVTAALVLVPWPSRPSRCGSASPTPATTPPTRRPAGPTT